MISIVTMRSMHEFACLVEKISVGLYRVNKVLISTIESAYKTIQGYYMVLEVGSWHSAVLTYQKCNRSATIFVSLEAFQAACRAHVFEKPLGSIEMQLLIDLEWSEKQRHIQHVARPHKRRQGEVENLLR